MKVFDTGASSAQHNMAIDYDLLKGLESSVEPLLHLYDWTGRCATYGHFLKPEKLLHHKSDWQFAQRPTGGGMVFHEGDFAFSVLVPVSHPAFSMNTLKNYACINGIILQAIKKFTDVKAPAELLDTFIESDKQLNSYCLAKPTKYDVMIQGGKVGGAAQRQTRWGFLHQGTIFLTHPPLEELASLLIDGEKITSAMRQNSQPLLKDSTSLIEAKSSLKECLINEFCLSF